jgi:hypothetical protein
VNTWDELSQERDSRVLEIFLHWFLQLLPLVSSQLRKGDRELFEERYPRECLVFSLF